MPASKLRDGVGELEWKLYNEISAILAVSGKDVDSSQEGVLEREIDGFFQQLEDNSDKIPSGTELIDFAKQSAKRGLPEYVRSVTKYICEDTTSKRTLYYNRAAGTISLTVLFSSVSIIAGMVSGHYVLLWGMASLAAPLVVAAGNSHLLRSSDQALEGLNRERTNYINNILESIQEKRLQSVKGISSLPPSAKEYESTS